MRFFAENTTWFYPADYQEYLVLRSKKKTI